METPSPTRASTRKSAAVGAVAGALFVVGSLFAFSSVAQADNENEAADNAVEDTEVNEAEFEKAFGDFEACLIDNGIEVAEVEFEEDGDFEDGSLVIIEHHGESSFADLSDGDGSVTVTSNDGDISVSSTGDVEIIDASEFEEVDFDEADFGDVDFEEFDETAIEEMDAVFEKCEAELPEGLLEELEEGTGDSAVHEYEIEE